MIYSHQVLFLTGCPQTLELRYARIRPSALRQAQGSGRAFRSAVAAGRIARFILTRLCCSQILSIQHLFLSSFSEVKDKTPAITSRRLPSVPCIWLSGLSSGFRLVPCSGPSSRDVFSITYSKIKGNLGDNMF